MGCCFSQPRSAARDGGHGKVPGGLAQPQGAPLKFSAIGDRYECLEQVQDDLRRNGLESSNLIVAIDFTKSNEWTGKQSFGGKSLHAIGDVASPYEEAISVIGRTLAAFDDDGLIPCYGFGDVTTGDSSVFSFLAGDKPCQGLEQALWRYRELCPYVAMAGPTSLAPAIRQASRIVEASGGQYHVLLLVADGQVSRPPLMPANKKSEQERDTIDAIVQASNLPLSIVMVGVGDGPWDLMKDFDDALPQRKFDNFQFVNFGEIMNSTAGDRGRRETQFAISALMEIPEQYNAIQRLGILGSGTAAVAARKKASHGFGNLPRDPPVPAHLLHTVRCTSAAPTPSAFAPGQPYADCGSSKCGGGGKDSYAGKGSNGGKASCSGDGSGGKGVGGGDRGGLGGSGVSSSCGTTSTGYPSKARPSDASGVDRTSETGGGFRASDTDGAGPKARTSDGAGGGGGDGGGGGGGFKAAGGVFFDSNVTSASVNSAGVAVGTPAARPAEPSCSAQVPAVAMPVAVPDAVFLCPITKAIMYNPVIAADGYTYERDAIMESLSRNGLISPTTQQRMHATTLIPNHGLRSSIMEWKQKNGVA